MLFKVLSTCRGGGYRYARTEPPHPRRNANDLYPLHRVLMENKLGCLLYPEEEVHHKDEDKTNDVVSNLVLTTKAGHARIHHPPRERIEITCPCGAHFYLAAHVKRQREQRKRSGLTCSRRCGRLYSAS